jgi:L-malate glycosyltransferase
MKVVILGNFPTYNFAKELGINSDTIKRITTWNENLANKLSQIEGVEVVFITSTRAINKTKIVKKGSLSVYFIVFPPKINVITFFQYAFYKVGKIIKQLDPDIVHGIGTEHVWPTIALKAKRKNVITIHGILHEFNKNEEIPYLSLKRYFSFLEKKILKRKQRIIAINPYVKTICNKLYKNHIYYDIPNPISPVFSSVVAEPEKSNQILFIGDFEKRKNVGLLLKALEAIDLALLNNTTIKIVGKIKSQVYYDELMDLTPKSILDKVEIVPFMLPEQIAEEMRKSAMLVLTSYNETAPMVIAESMTVGLPVIATNVGGVKYMIVQEKTGFVIEAGALNELVKCIKELIIKPNMRKKIGESARIFAINEYDATRVAKKTYNVYKKIIEDNEN